MRVMHGSQKGSVYGDERNFILIPVTDLARPQQRAYRAYQKRGLDTRSLMQIALAYSRPFHLYQLPPDFAWDERQRMPMCVDEHDVVTRIRNLLRHTDLLIEPATHSREVDQLLDFVVEAGPRLRLRLEYYSGNSDLSANVDRAESDFVIVGVQRRQPEYNSELILHRGPDSRVVRRVPDRVPPAASKDDL